MIHKKASSRVNSDIHHIVPTPHATLFIEYCIPTTCNSMLSKNKNGAGNATSRSTSRDVNQKIQKQSKTPHVKSTKPLLFHNIHYETNSIPPSMMKTKPPLPQKQKRKLSTTSCNYSLHQQAALGSSPTTIQSSSTAVASSPNSHCTVISPTTHLVTTPPCISTVPSNNEQFNQNCQYVTKMSKDLNQQYPRQIMDTTYKYHENGSCMFHWKNWQESSPKQEFSNKGALLKDSNQTNQESLNRAHTPPMQSMSLTGMADHSKTPSFASHQTRGFPVPLNDEQGNSKILPSLNVVSGVDHDAFFKNHQQRNQFAFLPPLQFVEQSIINNVHNHEQPYSTNQSLPNFCV